MKQHVSNAMDMEVFYTTLRETALNGFKRLNKTSQVERKRWEIPDGSWEVTVVRGAVLEKATTSRILLNTKNPLTGEDTRFNVFQIKAYLTSATTSWTEKCASRSWTSAIGSYIHALYMFNACTFLI